MRQRMIAIVGDDNGDGEYGGWCRVGDAYMAMRAAGCGGWFVVGCVVIGGTEVGGWSR